MTARSFPIRTATVLAFVLLLVPAMSQVSWGEDATGPTRYQEIKGATIMVCYVGNNVVDLVMYDWAYLTGNVNYVLEREGGPDGTVTLATFTDKTYQESYLDKAVVKGTQYTYTFTGTNDTCFSKAVLTLTPGRIGGSNMRHADTWTMAGGPYVITNDHWEGGLAVNAKLTIESGAEVYFQVDPSKSSTGLGLHVSEAEDGSGGVLTARGSPVRPIKFFGTTLGGEAIGQIGLQKESMTSAAILSCDSVLENCVFDGLAMVETWGNSPLIRGCEFLNCYAGLVVFESASPRIENNMMHHNEIGIDCEHTTGAPIITGNWIYNNSMAGMIGPASNPVIQAQNNFWGNNSGPRDIIRNPKGGGDNVTGNVSYKPWTLVPDFKVNNIWVIQVIDGGKLVAGKSTIVAVNVTTDNVTMSDVMATLLVDGTPKGTMTKDLRANFNAYTATERENCRHLYIFDIGGLSEGEHTVEVQIDRYDRIKETQEGNNKAVSKVSAKSVEKELNFLFIPVKDLLGRYPNQTNMKTTIAGINAKFPDILPMPAANYHSQTQESISSYTFKSDIPLINAVDEFLWFSKRFMLLRMDYNIKNDPNIDAIVGIVPYKFLDSWFFEVQGAQYHGGVIMVDEMRPQALTHEYAHMLGAKDEYNGDFNRWWTKKEVNGNQIGDGIMYRASDKEARMFQKFVYCHMGCMESPMSLHIEASCYNTLFDQFTTSTRAGPSTDPVDVIMAEGARLANGTVSLMPLRTAKTTMGELVPNEPGPYTASCLDASGTVLSNTTFRMEQGVSISPFAFQMSCPEAATSLEISYGGKVLISVPRSASPPSLTIAAPQVLANGTVSLSWSGSDADGGKLFYSVSYSCDGRIWQPAIFLTDSTQAYFRSGELPGGASCQFRVEVLDGFDMASADSAKFALTDLAPKVQILRPETSLSIPAGTDLVLSGSGEDPETGLLDGGSLTWSSSRDGYLGTGLSIVAGNLSSGAHIITLTGQDALGTKGTAAVSVNVGLDLEAPVIGSVSIEPASAFQGQPVEFAMKATDDTAVAYASVRAGDVVLPMAFDPASNAYTCREALRIPAGAYEVRFFATDMAGNEVMSRSSLTITENTPPVLSNLSVQEGSVILSGAKLNMSVDAFDAQDGAMAGTSVTWWSDRDGFLGPGTSISVPALSSGPHAITVEAWDQGGLRTVLQANVHAASHIPPGPPSGVKCALSDGGVCRLSWNATDEPDFKEYRVYIDNGTGPPRVLYISDPAITEAVVQGIGPGTWRFNVTVVSKNGAESPPGTASVTISDEGGGGGGDDDDGEDNALRVLWAVISVLLLVGIIAGVFVLVLRHRKGGMKDE